MHALSFALGFIIMNAGLIPHDDAIYEVLSFAMSMFQMIGADVHMRTLTLFCQLPGHKPCENKGCCTLLKTGTLG
jgi:hypothetical protein